MPETQAYPQSDESESALIPLWLSGSCALIAGLLAWFGGAVALAGIIATGAAAVIMSIPILVIHEHEGNRIP